MARPGSGHSYFIPFGQVVASSCHLLKCHHTTKPIQVLPSPPSLSSVSLNVYELFLFGTAMPLDASLRAFILGTPLQESVHTIYGLPPI